MTVEKDGGRPVPAVPDDQLLARTQHLRDALEHGGARLPVGHVDAARVVLDKVAARTALGGTRTVVALAGATGSGKSTLFNALVGEPVSRIGARRPTTSRPAAAVWGAEASSDLLSWLQVDIRHQVAEDTPHAAELDGMVLLDLPDFDSHVGAHRREADRVLDLADVFVWVTDPQKYADAVMHRDYVSKLSGHDAVTIAVLNQVDLLPRGQVRSCVDDLRRLMLADGLDDVQIIPASAAHNRGVDEIVLAIAHVVRARNAAEQRLLGDLAVRAERLREHVADREPAVQDASLELDRALGKAAAVPVVLDAVERDFVMRATQHAGWPFTRWVTRLRPAPLSRLGLDKVVKGALSRQESSTVLGRSSLPPASPAARAGVDLATRTLSEQASQGLPPPWADDVQDAAVPDEQLYDELDRGVMGVSLRGREPGWWTAVSLLQWLLAVVAIVGAAWLLGLWILRLGQIEVAAPTQGVFPVPLLMLVIGVVLGVGLAALSRWLARQGARRRRRVVATELGARISTVAAQQVTDPVNRVLTDHRLTRTALDEATR